MSARPDGPPDAGLVALDGGRRCALTVRAQPGARRDGFAGTWNGLLKVAVRAPALDGRANEALAEELARLLRLKPAALTLVAGAAAREKRFEIDADARAVAARLARLVQEATPEPPEARP